MGEFWAWAKNIEASKSVKIKRSDLLVTWQTKLHGRHSYKTEMLGKT